MDPFRLLVEASKMSRTISLARDYINGGRMVETLTAIGDVHLRSAIEHLAQAERSPQHGDRLMQAVGDLQVAYFGYSKGSARGFVSLRRWTDVRGLERLHGLAAGSAATVALLQWYFDEHPANRRDWLDRVARHVSNNWRNARARATLGQVTTEVSLLMMAANAHLGEYFELEGQLLPPELVRPRPIAHVPSNLLTAGVMPSLLDPDHMLPRYERRD